MHLSDCHLMLKADNLGARIRPLIEALLRVDLGARIKPDPRHDAIDIEGRFRPQDIAAAVQQAGATLLGIEVRPPSPKPGAHRGRH